MTKQEYLNIRNTVSLGLMYEYYTEHFDHDRHNPFLNINEFAQLIQVWPGANAGYQKVIEHYDEKFGVMVLKDKQGNIIKYL